MALCATKAQAGPVGTIFSGTTAADGATPYWNPGAMTLINGTEMWGFISLSAIRVHYQRDVPSPYDGQPYPQADFSIISPDPLFGAVTDFGLKDWRFGLSVSIPWADGAGWAETFEGKTASTAYHGLSPRIGQLFISTALAYRINDYISLGAGIDIVALLVHHEYLFDFASRINQLACLQAGGAQPGRSPSCPINAPFARENPGLAGRVNVDAFGWGVGAFAGLLITPTRWLRLGTGFHSNAGTMKLAADMEVQIPPAVTAYVQQNLPGVSTSALSASGELSMGSPMVVTAGIGILPIDGLEIDFDLHWLQMSVSAVILGIVHRSNNSLMDDVVTIKGRNDNFRLALHGAYDLLEDLTVGLRIGYSSDTRPEAFVTPTSLDLHKLSLQFGLIWKFTDWFALEMEYQHFVLIGRTVRVSRFGPNPLPATPEEQGFDTTPPTGKYWVEADSFGAGLRVTF